MRRWFIGLIAVLWPILGNSEPLTVQTGEHGTFTRIVVTVPEGSNWRLGRQSDGYVLRAATREGFALNRFFDLIPRSRILEVSQDAENGELFLRVACECNAQASIFQSVFLVIDIVDGVASADSPFEVLISAEVESAETLPSESVIVVPYFPDDNRILPLITPRLERLETDMSAVVQGADELDTSEFVDETEQQVNAEQSLRMIEQTLIDSLGRGLSDGLLEQGFNREAGAGELQEGLESTPLRSSESVPGLSLQTGIDPLAVSGAKAEPETQVGRACLPSDAFDIASWGDDSPPHQQLHNARRALVDEADQVQETEIYKLAGLYIFLGFGREAQQILDADNIQSRERVIMRAIAQLIDDEAGTLDMFAGQVSCPSNVALWALLARGPSPVDGQVDRTAVVNAYKALPAYVKQAVAPRLVKALLVIGAEDEAMQVLGRDPKNDNINVELTLASAALANALGDELQAIEIISNVARNEQRTTPEVMTRFFREGIKKEISFTADDFLLADALRFEAAGSPSAATLAAAQFDAYLFAKRFENGRDLLAQQEAGFPNTAILEARDQLLKEVTERSSDAAFLDFIWQENPNAQDIDTMRLVAERLAGLGFSDQAAKWDGQFRADSAESNQAALAMQIDSLDISTTPSPPEASQQSDTLVADVATAAQDMVAPSLRNGRALVESATASREEIRVLLERNPAPSEF